MEHTTQDFDGVFRFTNASDEDITFLWNNNSYTFKAGTCSPMLIKNETSENVQEIRKMWAKKYAMRQFYKTDEYFKMSQMGNGLPPTFDDDRLRHWIQQCLEPLPIARADVVEGKPVAPKLKAFRSVDDKKDLKDQFKDELEKLG